MPMVLLTFQNAGVKPNLNAVKLSTNMIDKFEQVVRPGRLEKASHAKNAAQKPENLN